MQIVYTFKIQENLSWNIFVMGQKLTTTNCSLSTLVQKIISFDDILDCCIISCGNSDENLLVAERKRKFMNVSGIIYNCHYNRYMHRGHGLL